MANLKGLDGNKNIQENFQNIPDDIEAVNSQLENHVAGIADKHDANDVDFNSSRPTIPDDNVFDAIETVDKRIDGIVNNPDPNKDLELVDARTSSEFGAFATLKERNDNADVLFEKQSLMPKQLGGGFFANGDFKIRQRGDSFVGMSAGRYDADQHFVQPEAGAIIDVSFPQIQDLGIPFRDYHRLTFTTFGNATSKGMKISLKELKKFAGETITLSHYARAGKAVNVQCAFFNFSGLTGTIEFVGGGTIKNYSIGTNWARYDFQISVGTDLDGTDDTSYLWLQYIRLNDAGFGLDTLDSSAIKIEVSDKPSKYISDKRDSDLLKCRYYFRREGYGYLGIFATASIAQIAVNFDSPMRIAPSVTLNKTDPTLVELGVALRVGVGSVLSNTNADVNGVDFEVNGFSGAGSLNTALVRDNAFDISAEV